MSKYKQYQVLGNDIPADCFHHNVPKSYSNSIFCSFEKAESYALDWLGAANSPGVGHLKPNEKYFYYGRSNIEIREL